MAATGAHREPISRGDLARAVAKDGRRLMQWLASEGIDLSDLGQYHTHVLSPVARTGSGLKWENYAGDIALQRFEASLKKRGGQLLRGTRATALKPGKDGVEVEAQQGGNTKTFKAKAVVIADGGFTANTELVREHVSRTPEKLLQRHGKAATGDGLRMAQAVGAARSVYREIGRRIRRAGPHALNGRMTVPRRIKLVLVLRGALVALWSRMEKLTPLPPRQPLWSRI